MSESGYINSRQVQKKNVSTKTANLPQIIGKENVFASIARLDGKSFGSHGFVRKNPHIAMTEM